MMELKQSSVRSTQCGTKSGAAPVFERTCLVRIEATMIDGNLGLAAQLTTKRPMIVVGLGARSAATAAEVLSLVDSVLIAHHLTRQDIALCTTAVAKRNHPALVQAAAILGVPLVGRDTIELDRSVPNPSPKVADYVGVASVAEASALSFGPLVAEKHRSANATCALSRLQTSVPSAAIAASTLATSSAGP